VIKQFRNTIKPSAWKNDSFSVRPCHYRAVSKDCYDMNHLDVIFLVCIWLMFVPGNSVYCCFLWIRLKYLLVSRYQRNIFYHNDNTYAFHQYLLQNVANLLCGRLLWRWLFIGRRLTASDHWITCRFSVRRPRTRLHFSIAVSHTIHIYRHIHL